MLHNLLSTKGALLIESLALVSILYAQLGYLAVMTLLARWRQAQTNHNAQIPSEVSIILCVHNGESKILSRVQNLLHCDWQGAREIIVFCDGCSDGTLAILSQFAHPDVRVLSSTCHRGKAAAINDSVKAARYSFVVFADLRQTFETQALKRLAEAFRDNCVAAVSGRLEIAPSSHGSGRGVDVYWRMESKLRELEARYDSVIGCTGAIYAIRREHYSNIAADTILDDVVIPMQMAASGFRILYEPYAVAYDPQELSPERERARKLRTLVGNYQMLHRNPSWLLPWRSRLWWQFFSHKIIRLAVPWLMIGMLITNFVQFDSTSLSIVLIGQVTCYGLALAGLISPRSRHWTVTMPAAFLMLQWTCAKALIMYLRHRKNPLHFWSTPHDSRHPTQAS